MASVDQIPGLPIFKRTPDQQVLTPRSLSLQAGTLSSLLKSTLNQYEPFRQKLVDNVLHRVAFVGMYYDRDCVLIEDEGRRIDYKRIHIFEYGQVGLDIGDWQILEVAHTGEFDDGWFFCHRTQIEILNTQVDNRQGIKYESIAWVRDPDTEEFQTESGEFGPFKNSRAAVFYTRAFLRDFLE